MTRVILVPIVHNLADLGSLAESVRARYLQRFGPAVWRQRERAVEKLWGDIRRAIEALALDYRRTRIYQDGMPVCGQEEQIVRELAAAGSLNHQLILELLRLGACLVGTEDPQLLIREYQMQRRLIGAASAAERPLAPSPGEAAELLAARDRFIAERIAATLAEGETALLFVGAAHGLEALRASGIDVQTLSLAP
jgi:hypothetical protein